MRVSFHVIQWWCKIFGEKRFREEEREKDDFEIRRVKTRRNKKMSSLIAQGCVGSSKKGNPYDSEEPKRKEKKKKKETVHATGHDETTVSVID